MQQHELQARFDFACRLVEEAGSFALGHFGRLASLTIRSKGRQDLASEADLDTELLIRERLAGAFPADAFFGEETGYGALDDARGIWVVDPIDGTQPFLAGLSAWCVSVAFVADGVLEFGLVTAPARRETYVGRRGGRATLNGAPIQVSAAARLDEGMVGVGYSLRVTPAGFLPMFGRLLEQGGMFTREGSGALSLCSVACGRLIGYVEPHINSYDCLGALAVIEAAGGRFNDFLADGGLVKGNRLVAGPPALFPALAALFD